MGSSQAEVHYIGTIDARGRILDAIRLRDGSNSEFFLHSPVLR
jgi:hypothetical protein